jgi:hypothetical protein
MTLYNQAFLLISVAESRNCLTAIGDNLSYKVAEDRGYVSSPCTYKLDFIMNLLV